MVGTRSAGTSREEGLSTTLMALSGRYTVSMYLRMGTAPRRDKLREFLEEVSSVSKRGRLPRRMWVFLSIAEHPSNLGISNLNELIDIHESTVLSLETRKVEVAEDSYR